MSVFGYAFRDIYDTAQSSLTTKAKELILLI